jgi:hypothetical protein
MKSRLAEVEAMMRAAGLVAAFSLLNSATMAYTECLWSVRWPNDDRIRTVPWGAVPRASFVTRIECESAIESMLQEALRDRVLLIEVPACVCVPTRDDFARPIKEDNTMVHRVVDRESAMIRFKILRVGADQPGSTTA